MCLPCNNNNNPIYKAPKALALRALIVTSGLRPDSSFKLQCIYINAVWTVMALLTLGLTKTHWLCNLSSLLLCLYYVWSNRFALWIVSVYTSGYVLGVGRKMKRKNWSDVLRRAWMPRNASSVWSFQWNRKHWSGRTNTDRGNHAFLTAFTQYVAQQLHCSTCHILFVADCIIF